MDQVLEKLKEGILRFQTEVYPPNAEKYKKAATAPQQPSTLIVTCADSRIDPELITQSRTGEIFVTRNIGNLVPAYGEMMGGVSAVIEYAVSALKVKHIAVCGHSDCGAMKALLNPASLDSLASVKNWMRNAEAALSVADSLAPDGEGHPERLKRLTEENVLLQMQHLRTHPSVAGAIARKDLSLSGWVYDIGTGRVRISEDGDRHFHTVGDANA
ncbi:carbonic anhydrase [Edaphobacter sp. HDX4]|uniref:carbonic anhydrase n=1 Tax=Edaphobacter sp. HDX4 TaxID=2794064 RepID=UPI002FE63402